MSVNVKLEGHGSGWTLSGCGRDCYGTADLLGNLVACQCIEFVKMRGDVAHTGPALFS